MYKILLKILFNITCNYIAIVLYTYYFNIRLIYMMKMMYVRLRKLFYRFLPFHYLAEYILSKFIKYESDASIKSNISSSLA